MPASPRAADRTTRSRMRAAASLTPANATVHRPAVTGMTRRARRASTATTAPAARTVAKSAPMPRAAIARISTVMTARRAATAAMPARPRVSRTGNSATRSPTRRAKAAERSGPIPRAARVFARTATAREQIARIRRVRRAMATVRAVIGPSGNSAATRSFPPRGAPDRGPRKDFGSRDRKSGPGDRGELKPWQKRDASSPDHVGRNARPSRSYDKPRFDKPREDRGGEERPRFSRPREDRPQGDRPFRERPKFDRPREGREDRSEIRASARGQLLAGTSAQRCDRPRRDNEDDSKVFVKRPAFGGRGAYRERKPDFEKRAAAAAAREEIRRAHCESAVAGGAGLAPRRRGMDRAGPRHRQRPRHQFAGARRHRQRRHHRRRQAVAAARAHAAVPVSQAARADDHPCRPRGAADGVRQSAGGSAAADLDRPARFQHRGPVAADQ